MNVDQVFAEENGAGAVNWLLQDNLGTVRDVVNYDPSTGQSTDIDHIQYDAFGNIASQSNPSAQPAILFTGQLWDAAAQLYNDDNRWYDPELGDFMSQDPLGFGGGDSNLMRYVGNDPTSFVDRNGLEEGRPGGSLPPGGGAAPGGPGGSGVEVDPMSESVGLKQTPSIPNPADDCVNIPGTQYAEYGPCGNFLGYVSIAGAVGAGTWGGGGFGGGTTLGGIGSTLGGIGGTIGGAAGSAGGAVSGAIGSVGATLGGSVSAAGGVVIGGTVIVGLGGGFLIGTAINAAGGNPFQLPWAQAYLQSLLGAAAATEVCYYRAVTPQELVKQLQDRIAQP